MAEEAPAVNEPVVADATTTDPAPVETPSEVAVDDKAAADKAVADSLAKGDTDSSEDVTTPEPVETQPEEQDASQQPQAKGYEARKEQLTGDITTLVAQRNALREEVSQLNSQVYRPATEAELQEQGYSPEMAAIEAFKQDQSIKEYNNQIADKQLELRSEALSIVRDFPELSPVQLNGEPNPTYNEVLGSQLESLLSQNLQVDPNTGQVVGSSIPPYQIYKLVADAAKASSEAGQLKGQRATEKMLASVDSPSSASPAKDNQEDKFLSGLLGEK